MLRNVKKIELWTKNPGQTNSVPIVRIDFRFPCMWTVIDSEMLYSIIKLWIQGEKIKLGGAFDDAHYLRELIFDAFLSEGIRI